MAGDAVRSRRICFYCNKPISKRQKSRDHFWPSSKGGRHNSINVIYCHRKCNEKKADRVPTKREYQRLVRVKQREITAEMVCFDPSWQSVFRTRFDHG